MNYFEEKFNQNEINIVFKEFSNFQIIQQNILS